ncbi:MAG: PAS domain-containing sensor histidine kinase, partial [Candidatus Limnocylindrales bacterium]
KRLGSPGIASGRAKGEIDRAGDVRFGTGQSLVVGLSLAWGAIALKAALNEALADDTGYVILMAATVLAAWFGGLTGGLTATVTVVILNSVVFLDDEIVAIGRIQQVRQVLFLVVATGTAMLIATRRASRDRLVDALDEVATLAEEVEARDARLELMLAASGTGFWEWEIPAGRLAWSEAIFRQHGLEPADEAPPFAAYLDMIHPDDRELFQSATTAAIETGTPLDLEFRIVWADGSVHWTHGAGRVIRDDEGRPLRMLGTGQDVTQRRRTTDERDRLLADERRAREFREAFVDVISHELRTPITTILGLTQILARPGRTDDEASRNILLEDIRSESERLHRLVEDLLVLSRVERGRLVIDAEPLEPRRLLERIVANEALELPSITVVTRLERDLPIVAGEATYVQQIVRNLLGNAAKYTPQGSTVVVSARRRGADVEVRVVDDGPGIPEGSIDRIFDLFFRDPDSARTVAGSGIGLFVCASLVEAMGGRIWARRRPEGGSEFGFTLLALEGDAVDADGTIEGALASLPVRVPGSSDG